MAGHDDDLGVRRDLLDLLEDLDAGQAGHAQIENGGVEGVFSRALTAALPSGQTVTSCPKRGSSVRMNSCSDFSSSANKMRRLL